MLKKLYRWLRGYVYVNLMGIEIERFLNLCNTREIKLWGLVHVERKYYCYMMLSDYRKIRPIARKSKVVPYIMRRQGFPFKMQGAKKRKGYILGFAMFCAIIYILSLYIWDIKIEGGYKHTEEELLNYLQTIEVFSGTKIKEIDCPLIEESIRKEYTDIGWVSAEILGTQLVVRIVETSVPSLQGDKLGTQYEYASIVANKPAMVVGIVTRKGVPKVSIGSIVKSGDVLISGVVPVIGDNDTLIENKLMIAEGDIQLRTYYEYKDEFSLKYNDTKYTGRTKKGLSLYLFGRKIFSYSPSNSYEHCDIISEVQTLKLIRNFYLPVQFTKSKVSEYDVFQAQYTNAQATEIANKKLLRYMEELKKRGTTIVENQVKVSFENGKCISTGKIIVEEAAWQYEKINEDEWRITETDEHNGDNH